MFIDCSRTVTNKMQAFRLKNEDQTYTTFEVEISPFLTREQTKPKFSNETSFEISQFSFQSVVGTYVDSPYHRHEDMDDISKLELDQLIGEGVIIDATGLQEWEAFELNDQMKGLEITNKIVLFNFGWDKYFGAEQYHSYPFLSKQWIDYLVEQRPKMVGCDTVNIDDSNDLSRPAHTKLLRENILIIENLVNLDLLVNKIFRFYSIPAKFERAASFPVRAFAEVVD